MGTMDSSFSEQTTDYNNIASKYDIHEKNAATLWYLGYQYILSYLNPIAGKTILDYGCGSGTLCRFLHEYKAHITGVDISENMIKIAKEDYPDGIIYNQITPGNLDFIPENSFDFALSNFVLCTISTRKEISEILKSIFRILKKGGSFIILNPNWDKSNGKEFISFKLQYSGDLYSGKPVTAVIKTEPPIILNDYYWSKADYLNLLADSGFEIQGIEEPLAKGNCVPWMAEKSYPPYHIIRVRK
jgi:ubiquinone/menaquinone biosynthesis C-methylase UbiE